MDVRAQLGVSIISSESTRPSLDLIISQSESHRIDHTKENLISTQEKADSKRPTGQIVSMPTWNERDPFRMEQFGICFKRVANKRLSPPVLMAISLVSGIVFAVAHHFYYLWLNDKIVGSASRQQWSLRLGNLFAITVAFFLKIAVANAYWQCLGLKLKQQHVSLGALDDAFGVLGNMFSLVNKELFSKLRLATSLALVLWCIPIVSIFPPATLSVVSSIHTNVTQFEAWQPAISYPGPKSSYMPGFSEWGVTQSSQNLIQTLIDSVSFTGQVLPPKGLSSAANYSYTLQTYIPSFKCMLAPEQRSSILNASSILLGNDLRLPPISLDPGSATFAHGSNSGILFYAAFAGIRAATNYQKTSDIETGGGYGVWNSQGLDDYLAYLDGSLLLALGGPAESIGYFSCQLYNSSVEAKIKFDNNRAGSVEIINTTNVSPITDFTLNEDTNLQIATRPYYFWFKELSNLIIGTWYGSKDSPDKNATGSMSAGPQSTILVESNDLSTSLQHYCNYTHVIYPSNQIYPQNRSMIKMLEELSLNISMSIMNQPSLCRTINVTGNISTSQNVYHYQSANVIISYSIAILFTLTSVLAGSYSFHKHKITYDNKLSTIGGFMQNPELFEILNKKYVGDSEHATEPANAKKAKLRLGKYTLMEKRGNEEYESEHLGFIVKTE